MPTEKEIQSALLAIYSRLGIIEGKVNLVARADRPQLLALLEETVRQQPLIGQIYLLLDGTRSQKDVQDKLNEFGISPSQPTVSRRFTEMVKDHGIAESIEGPSGTVYRRDREMEKVLNLSKNVRKWLAADGNVVPEAPVRRRGASSDGDSR